MSEYPDPRPDTPPPPRGGPGVPFMNAAGRWTPAGAEPIDLRDLYAQALDDERPRLRDYWWRLVRYRWTVIIVFLVTVVTAAVWTFTRKPVYTSTVTLQIEREAPRVLTFEEVVRTDLNEDYYQTQYRILRSRSLANRVIGMLALDQHPEFQNLDDQGLLTRAKAWVQGHIPRPVWEHLARWLPIAPPEDDVAQDSDDATQESLVTRAFRDRLTIKPVRQTRLVDASFDSHDPALAARIANAFADAFVAQSLDQKVAAVRYANEFLTKEAEEARAKLEESERRLSDFLSRNRILFVGTSGQAGEGQPLVTQQLVVLSEALLRARADRIVKESTFARAVDGNSQSLSSVLANPVVGKYKEQLVALRGEYERLSQTFKPSYPQMEQIARNIREVRRQLALEARRTVEALESDYQTALGTERELQKAVDRQQGLTAQLGQQMAEYRVVRREADTNQALYTTLLTRLKETGVASSLLASNISVVDRAEDPLYPSKPRTVLNLLFAAALGLVGGVGLALFRDYLDITFKDPNEVETALGLPTLALVPSRGALERQGGRAWLAEEDPAPFALVSHTQMESTIAEAFRTLRTCLLHSLPDHPPRTLMVTSPDVEEGKTSLAANLAIVLAQLGIEEVLLVDGDMRRPDLHRLFEVSQTPGLSTFLTGQADELDEVIKPTQVPNLFVLPSGKPPLNPAELLSSARLRRVMDDYGKRFRHVVFDSPPLFGVSDAMALAPKVDGVVLVLRHGRSSRDAAHRAVRYLEFVHARLLGVVLNDVDVRSASHYGLRGYYGYGAGPSAPDKGSGEASHAA